MNAPKRTNRGEPAAPGPGLNERQTVREAVKRIIRNHQAWESFRTLVSLKFDEEALCNMLATIGLVYPVPLRGSFEARFGFERRKFRTVLKRMHQCASDIDQISIVVLRDLPSYPTFEPANLPTQLRTVAHRLQIAAFATRERGRPHYDRALAALVHHVLKKTGRPLHKDVANLVAAMRGDNYSEKAHKEWAHQNQRLIQRPW